MKDRISAKIKILHDLYNPGYYLGKEINAEATIIPKVDIAVESIKYELYIQVDNSSDDDLTIDVGNLQAAGLLKAGETYTYRFSFKNDKMNPYHGRNVSYISKLCLIVKEKKSNNNNTFTKIKEWISPTDEELATRIIPFKVRPENFEFPTQLATFQFDFRRFSKPIGIFLFVIFALWTFNTGPVMYYLLVLAGVIASFFGLYYLIGKHMVKDVLFEINRKALDVLEVRLTNKDDWGYVNKAILNYIIEEKVVIKGGKSDHIDFATIYESPEKEFSDFSSGALLANFHFSEKYPLGFDCKYSSVYWVFKLKVITPLGIPVFFKCEVKPYFQYSRNKEQKDLKRGIRKCYENR